MFNVKGFFSSMQNTIQWTFLVNVDPSVDASAEARRNLRRWRSKLGENWSIYQSGDALRKQHMGIAFRVIMSPDFILQARYTLGVLLPEGEERTPANASFFPLMTDLLTQAAAEEP